jgi:chromosome segregation ATPase
VELPRRLLGGVDRGAAERAIAEQRRAATDLSRHVERLEIELEAVRRDRDLARADLREMQAEIADVLRLATRAAADTEAETAARTSAATEEARRRVEQLRAEATTAAEAALALATSLAEAVQRHRSLPDVDLSDPAPPAVPPDGSVPAAAPDEPFLEHDPQPRTV